MEIDFEILRKVAEVLGTDFNSIREFPEDVQSELISAFSTYTASDELSAHKQYEELEHIWSNGTIALSMQEVSDNTGIDINRLKDLDENEKLNVLYEYSIGTDTDTLLRMIDER